MFFRKCVYCFPPVSIFNDSIYSILLYSIYPIYSTLFTLIYSTPPYSTLLCSAVLYLLYSTLLCSSLLYPICSIYSIQLYIHNCTLYTPLYFTLYTLLYIYSIVLCFIYFTQFTLIYSILLHPTLLCFIYSNLAQRICILFSSCLSLCRRL